MRGVVDALQIVPPEKGAAIAEKDESTHAAISKRLEASRQLSEARIVVEVKNRIARLSGNVASPIDRLTALTMTRTTPGVRGLVDELKVGPRAASAR